MWGQCGSKFRIGKTRSLSRLVCVPRFFFVSFASSQVSRVFRLVYRPYRSFRFVFSSLVVSTSFVSFASRFVLCLTFSSFFVLLFSFNLFLLHKQCSFLYEFVSSCEVLLRVCDPKGLLHWVHFQAFSRWCVFRKLHGFSTLACPEKSNALTSGTGALSPVRMHNMKKYKLSLVLLSHILRTGRCPQSSENVWDKEMKI